MPQIAVTELAVFLGAEWSGDPNLVLTGVAPLAEAGADQLSFVADRRYADEARTSGAGAILAQPGMAGVPSHTLLAVPDPYGALHRSLVLFYPPVHEDPLRASTAIVAPSARVDLSSRVESFVTIGDETSIAKGVIIRTGVRIGRNVSMGECTIIGENAVIADRVQLGERVRIGPGTVIGSIGFGFVTVDGRPRRMPHVGTVVIGDDVEIGANCTVDRGTLGATRIGNGSKLDNLVHVAHNVQIGANVFVAAQCGFAGSVKIGNDVQFGGQAGVSGHITIAAGSRIAAKAGVMKSSSGTLAGHPARPLMQQRRAEAALLRMDDLVKRIQALEKSASRADRGRLAEG